MEFVFVVVYIFVILVVEVEGFRVSTALGVFTFFLSSRVLVRTVFRESALVLFFLLFEV